MKNDMRIIWMGLVSAEDVPLDDGRIAALKFVLRLSLGKEVRP